MESVLQCKFVFTKNNGFCLIENDLIETKDGFEINNIGKIHSSSAILFKNSDKKFFYAIKDKEDDKYRLIPIKNSDVKKRKKERN